MVQSLRGTQLDNLARQFGIPVHYESSEFLESISQNGVHQGVVARLLPFPYSSLKDILSKQADLLLVLDGVVDPRNLGALLRTADGAGVGGVILTSNRSAPISSLTEKSATGATVHIPVCRVENLARTLSIMRKAGYWLIGLVQDEQRLIYHVSISSKVALILGGEEKGLRFLTRKMCDYLVAIPMSGGIPSLNVSVAGAIALYEFSRKLHYPEHEPTPSK